MKRKAGLFAITVLVVMMIAGAAVAGVGDPSTTEVVGTQYFANGADAGGKSILTRTDTMIVSTVEAANLEPGDVYTVWFVVFNNPEACSGGVCGEDDIFKEDGTLNMDGVKDAQIGVGNATGNVAKADGTAEFGGVLWQGQTADEGGHQMLFGAGLNPDGVLLTADPNAAEVHLIIQSHGQARGGPQLLQQLSYVEFGCTPECADLQFAVHTP